jgi:hypothetical protein
MAATQIATLREQVASEISHIVAAASKHHPERPRLRDKIVPEHGSEHGREPESKFDREPEPEPGRKPESEPEPEPEGVAQESGDVFAVASICGTSSSSGYADPWREQQCWCSDEFYCQLKHQKPECRK